MPSHSVRIAWLLVVWLCLVDGHAAAQVGTIRFPNSGTPAAQADFLRGIALLHSFAYEQAAERFRAAERADPSFALPYWFEANTHRHALWSEENLAAARAALTRLGPDAATRLAKAKDPKERAYGAAIEALFANVDEAARTRAFADSMRRLAAKYPDDVEAAAFTSVAVMGAAVFMPPGQRGPVMAEAESLANRVFVAEPNHPGGAHYVIHAADNPDRAPGGLAAARAYAKIAPDVEHAQHMPSHIFVQLGMWDDAVQSNERAWKASRDEVAGHHGSGSALDFHDLNWLQYVYLQQGKVKAARALIDTGRLVLTGVKLDFDEPDARYAICDLAFRYAVETGDWLSWRTNTRGDSATNDTRRPPLTATLRAQNFAMRCDYSRASAEAMLGEPARAASLARAARRSLDTLPTNSQAALIAAFRAAQFEGLAARARDDRALAIAKLTEAAAAEERIPPLGPPNSIPTLELLGAELFAGGRAADAAAAYERALKRGQNRSAALLGLARARAKMGDRDAARSAYAKVLANWHAADADLSALPEARRETGAQTRGAPAANEKLPAWTPGTLDIHHISTGRGNATLFVMPDGTTLLVDAGAAADGIAETDPHPDASRSPGEWIARYVKRHVPDSSAGLDYALITHFHADHFGQLVAKSPSSTKGPYRLTGITEVGDAIRIRSLIDRGWPDYSYPGPFTDSTMANYRRFLEAQRTRGMAVARFLPGSRSQIRLQRDTATYPTFEIRNIIGNGDVWTGSGEVWRNLFPSAGATTVDDLPTENMCSLGFRLTYGPFHYFTGGDLPGTADPGFPAWHALEPAIAALVGKVDVHVVSQHGSMGQESDSFLRTLGSTVLIIPSWGPSHPAPDVLKRIMNSRYPPLPRYVFVTDLRDAARTVIGLRANAIAGPPGHVVVRVEPGGTRYQVFVISNKDENDAIVATKGPFDVGRGRQ